jgi:hypothetical protein
MTFGRRMASPSFPHANVEGTKKGSCRSALAFTVLLCMLIVMHSVVVLAARRAFVIPTLV